jgi:hypothetical protein
MDDIQHLRDQAARAERLAAASLDQLTIERLLAFSEEMRAEAERLARGMPKHH